MPATTPVAQPPCPVTAVVVSHHPDAPALQALLAVLADQVDGVIVVDNGSTPPPSVDPPARLIGLAHNLGIAAAQNRGVRAAFDAGAAQVLLLDQDSRPEPGMVAALQSALAAAAADGTRVAVAGPLIVDPEGRSEGFVRFRDGRYVAIAPSAADRWADCDLLIASGSLIPRAAWDDIGPMAEELFIDKVDTDWCLRAAWRGWRLIGVPAARLQHRLGRQQLRLWFFGWRRLAQHAAFRYYYIWRNGLLLRRRPHATPAWRRADARQLLSNTLHFGLLAPGRGAALRMMLRGAWDGLRRRSGPLR